MPWMKVGSGGHVCATEAAEDAQVAIRMPCILSLGVISKVAGLALGSIDDN